MNVQKKHVKAFSPLLLAEHTAERSFECMLMCEKPPPEHEHISIRQVYVNSDNNDFTCIVKCISHFMNFNYKHLALFSWQCKDMWVSS